LPLYNQGDKILVTGTISLTKKESGWKPQSLDIENNGILKSWKKL
jgi:hypothetical protein